MMRRVAVVRVWTISCQERICLGSADPHEWVPLSFTLVPGKHGMGHNLSFEPSIRVACREIDRRRDIREEDVQIEKNHRGPYVILMTEVLFNGSNRDLLLVHKLSRSYNPLTNLPQTIFGLLFLRG